MSNYTKQFIIAGLNFGIEDYKAPGDHFMPKLQEKRFKCWFAGCGIGNHDTIQEALKHIHNYAVNYLTRRVVGLQTELSTIQDAISELGDTTLGLQRFMVR